MGSKYEETQIKTLLDIDGEEDDAREAAAFGLGDVQPRPSRRSIAALVRAILTDPEERVRIYSLYALLRLASQPQNRQRPKRPNKRGFDISLTVEVAVLAALHDRSERVRAEAVSLLEVAGGKEFARKYAKASLGDISEEVRKSAAKVLGS